MRVYFQCLEASCPEQSKTCLWSIATVLFPKITKCGRLLSLVMKVCHTQEFLRLYSAFLLRCVFLCQWRLCLRSEFPGWAPQSLSICQVNPTISAKHKTFCTSLSPNPWPGATLWVSGYLWPATPEIRRSGQVSQVNWRQSITKFCWKIENGQQTIAHVLKTRNIEYETIDISAPGMQVWVAMMHLTLMMDIQLWIQLYAGTKKVYERKG